MEIDAIRVAITIHFVEKYSTILKPKKLKNTLASEIAPTWSFGDSF